MKFEKTKPQQVRTSFSLRLPVELIKNNEMKKSGPVRIGSFDDGSLMIAPVPQSDPDSKRNRNTDSDNRSKESAGHEE